MKTLLIQPFRQRVIWTDPMFRDGRCSLEKLKDDLSFERTEFTYHGNVRETLQAALEENKARPEGWVKIEVESFYEFGDIWPLAVAKVGNGDTYTCFELQ